VKGEWKRPILLTVQSILNPQSAFIFFQLMTKVALLLSLWRGYPVHGVVLREGLRIMAFETNGEIFLSLWVVPIQGHPWGSAFRCHEEEDEDGRTNNQEYYSLNLFVHGISTVYEWSFQLWTGNKHIFSTGEGQENRNPVFDHLRGMIIFILRRYEHDCLRSITGGGDFRR
jgi:hypothetical protein